MTNDCKKGNLSFAQRDPPHLKEKCLEGNKEYLKKLRQRHQGFERRTSAVGGAKGEKKVEATRETGV